MRKLTLGGMEGSIWKHHRKLLGNAFHFENLKRLVPILSDITKSYLEKW